MTRAENLLFALYAFRVSILDREQFLSICLSLRHGKDIDLGASLVKRGLVDDRQASALWSLASIQAEVHGSAKKALMTVDSGEQLRAAILAAIKPQPAPKGAVKHPKGDDPPTISFDLISDT